MSVRHYGSEADIFPLHPDDINVYNGGDLQVDNPWTPIGGISTEPTPPESSGNVRELNLNATGNDAGLWRPEPLAEKPEFKRPLHSFIFNSDHTPAGLFSLKESVDRIPELTPARMVEVGDRRFEMSNIVKSSRYDLALLYAPMVINDEALVAPRLLYKSQSDGGWRCAYFLRGDHEIVKTVATDTQYVQETKLVPELLLALDESDEVVPPKDMYEEITTLFNNKEDPHPAIYTAYQEVESYTDPAVDSAMAPFRALHPGQIRYHDIYDLGVDYASDYFRSLDAKFLEAGFMPDFTQAAQTSVQREHTLLGQTQIETYPAMIGATPITWHVAHQGDRVWIDNITIDGADVTSYGTYKPIFYAGIITMKPLNYAQAFRPLRKPDEYRDFGGDYIDTTPLLDNLLPIRQYRGAKGLSRNTDVV